MLLGCLYIALCFAKMFWVVYSRLECFVLFCFKSDHLN